MTRSDVRFDEYMGGERTPHNFLSVPSDGKLYLATKKAIHYTPPTQGDGGRMLVPSVVLEYLLQDAPIAKRANLTGIMVLTHCLAEDYLGRVFDLLEDAGLFYGQSKPRRYEWTTRSAARTRRAASGQAAPGPCPVAPH